MLSSQEGCTLEVLMKNENQILTTRFITEEAAKIYKAQEEKNMRWAGRYALEKEKARKESLISCSHSMTNKGKRRKR